MELRKPYSLGIDINDQYAVVSYLADGMREPESISIIAGQDAYRVPTLVARKMGSPQWYYGEEARRMAKSCEVIFVDHLLTRAADGDIITIDEEDIPAEQLLLLFLQKLMLLPQRLGSPGRMGMVTITLERLTQERIALFGRIAAAMELEEGQLVLLDHKQAFYAFALSQPKELWLHDVYLFEYENERIHSYALSRNEKTRPQMVSIEESEWTTFPADRSKDEGFLGIIQKEFANRIISTVYLVGEGFEGDWMQASVNYLCRTRRAFIGRNLFSKGACYAALIAEREDWNYVYLSENDMKFNLSLQVLRAGKPVLYNLVSAGRNWFEAGGVCEVLLNDENVVRFRKQLPYGRKEEEEVVELPGLPQRPNRTTRLRITAEPIANDRISVSIMDLGFGEFFRGTDKCWEYLIGMPHS